MWQSHDEPAINAIHQETPLPAPFHKEAHDTPLLAPGTEGNILNSDTSSDGLHGGVGEQLQQNDNDNGSRADNISIRIKYMENERTFSVHKTILVGELKRY